jgi:hypothetical protein
LKCKEEWPCAKYHKQNYYSCRVEANKFGWEWDYCSPPFDRNENLVKHRTLNFGGNFGFETDMPPIELEIPQSPFTTSELKSENNAWEGYPFLYRVLDFDEGNGLDGLSSRSKKAKSRSSHIPRWSVLVHVVENSSRTPFISTSAGVIFINVL